MNNNGDFYENFNLRIEDGEKVLNFESLKNLTTLKIFNMIVTPKIIMTLSLCKSLKSMMIEESYYRYYEDFDGEIDTLVNQQKFDFLNLRELTLISETQSGDGFSLSDALPHIKCKDLFRCVIKISRNEFDENTIYADVFGFLNQLDRCDEFEWCINTHCQEQITHLTFEPKFLWKKLKLSFYGFFYRRRQLGVEGVEALCRASRSDAESEIIFEGSNGVAGE